MKNVTPAETAVIRSMLAAQPISERERISRSGIPSRTFRDVRARLYAERWLVDRYLPDPVVVRRPFVSFLLVEPYVERMDAVAEAWVADPTIVHMWRSAQGLVAVRLGNDPRAGLPGPPEVANAKAMRRAFAMTDDVRERPTPIYMDFEASWSRLFGLPGSLSYPQAWPSTTPGPRFDQVAQPSPAAWSALEAIVRRPFEIVDQGRNPILTAPFFLPPSQQRVLDRSWVKRRVFLDPTRLADMGAPKVETLVFVHGRLRPGADPRQLLDELLLSCGVTPFLYACDGSKVLMGSLSPAPPELLAKRVPSVSVSRTLGDHLEDIEVFRMPLGTLRTVVNHRYDRTLIAREQRSSR